MAELGQIFLQGYQIGQEGQQRALALAQEAEKIGLARSELEQKKQAQALAKSDWLAQHLGEALKVGNAKLRSIELKRLSMSAQQAGIPFDPDIAVVLQDDRLARATQAGLMEYNSLPDNERTRAAMDNQALGGNAALFEKTVSGWGELALKKQKLEMDKKLMNQPESPEKKIEFISNIQGKLETQLKDSRDALQAAESIENLANMPERNLNALTAQTLFARLKDPGGVVKEAEQAGVEKAVAQGALARATKVLREKVGGGVLNEKEWTALKEATDLLSLVHRKRIDKVKATYAPRLQGTGIDVEELFSGFPSTALPERVRMKLAGGKGTASPAKAGGAVSAGAASSAVPGLSPAHQAVIQRYPDIWARRMGQAKGGSQPSAPAGTQTASKASLQIEAIPPGEE